MIKTRLLRKNLNKSTTKSRLLREKSFKIEQRYLKFKAVKKKLNINITRYCRKNRQSKKRVCQEKIKQRSNAN